MADKNTLRKVYLEKRLFLSDEEFRRRNEMLSQRVVNFLQGRSFQSLHTFLSIKEKKEVDTTNLITFLQREKPEVKIAVSRTLPQGELSHYIYNGQLKLKKNKWGIPQPVGGNLTMIDALDIVFVPLISFDKSGHRIGYGAGYYDRFLAKVPKAVKIGLSLSPPLDEIPYADELDVRLNMCFTPFEIYQF